MASAMQVLSLARFSTSGDHDQWLAGAFTPHDEARGLFVLIRSKAASVEAVRDLIAVPPEIEVTLHLYAKWTHEGLKKCSAFGSEFGRSLTGWWAKRSRSEFRPRMH
jgi:hypothetical protein